MAKKPIPVFPPVLTSASQAVSVTVEHYASRSFAIVVVADRLAKWVNPQEPKAGIVLLTKQSWAAIKEHYRKTVSGVIPVILPPRRPETLVLSYPLRNYESDGATRSAEVWMRAQSF